MARCIGAAAPGLPGQGRLAGGTASHSCSIWPLDSTPSHTRATRAQNTLLVAQGLQQPAHTCRCWSGMLCAAQANSGAQSLLQLRPELTLKPGLCQAHGRCCSGSDCFPSSCNHVAERASSCRRAVSCPRTLKLWCACWRKVDWMELSLWERSNNLMP